MALVGEAVELGTHLPKLGGDDFFVAAALVRLRIDDRALRMQIKTAGSLNGHARPEHTAEFDHVSGADQPRRIEHQGWRHVVGRTPLVAGAPLRRAACALGGWLPGLGTGDR